MPLIKKSKIQDETITVSIPLSVGVNISQGRFVVRENSTGQFALAHASNSLSLVNNVYIVLEQVGVNCVLASTDKIYNRNLVSTHGLVAGTTYYLSETNPGKLQTAEPTVYKMPLLKVISPSRSMIIATPSYNYIGGVEKQVYSFHSNFQVENGNVTFAPQADESVILTDATNAGFSNLFTREFAGGFLVPGNSYTMSVEARSTPTGGATSATIQLLGDISFNNLGVNRNQAITTTYSTISQTFNYTHTGTARVILQAGTHAAGGEGSVQFRNLVITRN
jgi:hypothetical protein